MALADKRQCCRIQTSFSGFNASAVVDNQSETHRNILMLEYGYRLRDTVLRDFEILHRQTTDISVFLIHDGNMKLHEIRVHTQYKWGRAVLTFKRECKDED